MIFGSDGLNLKENISSGASRSAWKSITVVKINLIFKALDFEELCTLMFTSTCLVEELRQLSNVPIICI